jgi:hypothetical protein
VQVRGGIWCFESEQEARLYHPQTSHDLFVGYGAVETDEHTAFGFLDIEGPDGLPWDVSG